MKNHLHDKTIIHFKKWTRKRFAVFNSLSKTIKICSLNTLYIIIVSNCSLVHGQADTVTGLSKTYEFEEVEITGKPDQPLFPEVARLVTVIRHDKIAAAPVQSLQDLLEYTANLDICQRGMNGIQADISSRGGSFDHVLVLLNGIPMSDPQTGHFNLDIPIDIDAIDRIEILSGPASLVYGTGAFTGAINIVVVPRQTSNLQITLSAGDYHYKKAGVTATLAMHKLSNLVSFGQTSSDGYTQGTDFSLRQFYYTGKYRTRQNLVQAQVGYQSKEFGANGFYSPRFPGQYEENSTWSGSIHHQTGNDILVSSTAYWRRKQDHFVLIREKPDSIQNYHINYITGLQINAKAVTGKITSIFGVDLRYEGIISTSLGFEAIHPVRVRQEDSAFYTRQYNRSDFSILQEHIYNSGRFSASIGYRLNWNADYPERLSFFPGIDVGYTLGDQYKMFLRLNRSLRYPTFTDLFYTDPSHSGNLLLEPDHLISLEAGLAYRIKFVHGSSVLYKTYGNNIIDWLWSYQTSRYSPLNVSSIHTQGLELTADCQFGEVIHSRFPVNQLSVNYCFTNMTKSIPDSVSKYYNLKHKLSIMLQLDIFLKLHSSWCFSYQDRMGTFIQYDPGKASYYATPYKPFLLLDGNLFWDGRIFTYFVEASNILNTNYIDAGSIEQPGRWIKAGIKFRLSQTKEGR